MKHLSFKILTLAIAAAIMAACQRDEYDDSALRSKIDQLTQENQDRLDRINELDSLLEAERNANRQRDSLQNARDSIAAAYRADIQGRFIAHAGGAIAGKTYTNCLEALNLSYSKGCRMFEIDIEVTSDDKLIGAHDWGHAQSITGGTGSAPMTEAEWLAKKIYGQFTPLGMDIINEWFMSHPDATLVTDKINDPEKMLANIDPRYKNRLIMELFSWDAVDKAIEVGITPMPSRNGIVWGDLGPMLAEEHNAVEQKLSDLNIKYAAIDTYDVSNVHKEWLKYLKENGLRVYVFSIEFYESLKDYWEFNMNYYYGMYADNLDLLEQLLARVK